MKLLEVNNLSTGFLSESEVFRAVNNISFSLAKGKTTGIVGESGCGKSVTALSIMRLLPKPAGKIFSGSIIFKGQNLLKVQPREMERIRGNRIGMIFQEPMTALNPVLSIGKQMIESYRLHTDISYDAALRSAADMLDRVGLSSPDLRMLEYPHQLSGGMRQRVMIAMAIACNPDLLIADEPTTALDVTVQAQILQLIQELQKEMGMSVLIITHDLGVVAETCDDVVVMHGGTICETANVFDIFDRPNHDYTKSLLASIPRLDSQPKSILPVLGSITKRRKESDSNSDSLNYSGISQDSDTPEIGRDGPPSILKIEKLAMYFPIREGVLGRIKSYNQAVDEVSFSITRGQTLGLVGESGCGKSTIARCVLRLYSPTSGKIIFDGKDITKLKANQLRLIRNDLQMIFQDPMDSLNPRHTASEIIEEPLLINNFNKIYRGKRVLELLDIVGLPRESLKKYPFEFSGGQKQRIGIARALALKPKLVVCDEAVSALDVSTQAQILNLLLDLQREFGLTYLFISHNLAVVKHMSDKVAVMKSGKIVEENSSDKIYNEAAHPYTQKLISSIPVIHPVERTRSGRSSN
ncbi:ABC transporter ATP-binding protein [Gammaproteobacteria bacterium]|nr:ABC transporter ATP-binding protein [Gammaproteobacteria bacterium]